MNLQYNSRYPGIDDLVKRARKKIPKFAFEYLDGGCNEEVNLHKNTTELRQAELQPYYGADFTFLGRTFFYGVAAVGDEGGNHTISILKTQFKQVMEQVNCARVADLPNHLIKTV